MKIYLVIEPKDYSFAAVTVFTSLKEATRISDEHRK